MDILLRRNLCEKKVMPASGPVEATYSRRLIRSRRSTAGVWPGRGKIQPASGPVEATYSRRLVRSRQNTAGVWSGRGEVQPASGPVEAKYSRRLVRSGRSTKLRKLASVYKLKGITTKTDEGRSLLCLGEKGVEYVLLHSFQTRN